MSQFVHLHLHSQYSLLDGANRLDDVIAAAAAAGMPALAITDHGNMFGAVSFYREMKEQGIRPIVGCEVYMARGDRRDRTKAAAGEKDYNHLILLARDREGYHNLARLTSKAYREGFYYKPRIDRELLAAHSEGLIGLSACLSGVPQYHLARGREDEAAKSALEFRDILGEGNYFLEIQDHKLPDQRKIERSLRELSKRTGIPLVATNDAHYLTRDDHRAHDVLLCISAGKTVNDTDRLRFGGPEFYVRSPEEMWQIFGETPEVLRRTTEIAERCNLELPLGENHLPVYPIPAEFSHLSVDEYFDRTVREGFAERKAAVWDRMRASGSLRKDLSDYEARVSREIEMIRRMGFASYFLIVWDFIAYARRKGIPVGPGRGSSAGSLVAYCLHITDIDPLQYDLLFERFLNPERVSMPDIDIDFCVRGRADVINHVSELYGRDSVCQIITFGTMASKAAIKDVGRALDMPYNEVERIAKLIPPPVRGRNVSIKQAIETVPELRGAIAQDARVADVVDLAQRLEGCARHSSVHAAGVVISPRPLEELVPVAVSPKQELTSQYGMNDLEKAGMLKMDFLGLTTLTIIDQCRRTIRETLGVEIDWQEVPLDDPATYALFAEGRTEAVFQFEGDGIREIARRLKPTCLEDLSALNALYRPGPLDGGMVDEYIERFHGRKPVEYLLPEMEPILSNTYAIIVYQEQIMQLAQRLAGYTLADADLMRRAMGKKKPEEMAVHREKFVAGAVGRGIDRAKAEQIFDLMKNFADYGFNLSHAVCYAYLAFQTAYLKAHYPEHFYAAVLSHEADNTEKVYKYAQELKAQGIRLLPPDVNESGADFTPLAGGAIRFGLSAIRGIGESAVGAVRAARSERPFTSLFDFAGRVADKGVNRRVVESLVCAGAFDTLNPNGDTAHVWRARLHAGLGRALEYASRSKRDRAVGQGDLFGMLGGGGQEESPDEQLPQAEALSQVALLAAEKAAVGLYVSGHPLEEFAEALQALNVTRQRDLAGLLAGSRVSVGGIVAEFQQRTTKKGDRFAIFKLEDVEGASAKCVLWPDVYAQCAGRVEDGALLVVSGRVELAPDGAVSVIGMDLCAMDAEMMESAARAAGNRLRLGALAVAIEICVADGQRPVAETLLALLRSYPGECEVFLDLARPGQVVRVRPKTALKISPDPRLEHEILAAGCKVTWLPAVPETGAVA